MTCQCIETSSHDTVDSRDLIQETSPTTANDLCSRNDLDILIVFVLPAIIIIFNMFCAYKMSLNSCSRLTIIFFCNCYLILLYIYGHSCWLTSFIFSNLSVYILYVIFSSIGVSLTGLLCLWWLERLNSHYYH